MTRYRHLRRCIAIGFCALAFVGCKRSPKLTWNGTWKLNASESQAYGAHFAIGIAPDGLVTVTNEEDSYNFRCDNKEFTNTTGRPTVCTPLDDRHWRFTHRNNGKDSVVSVWEISPDGKTFTLRTTVFGSTGTQESTEKTSVRRSGAKGFEGQWQDLAPIESLPKVVVLAVDGQHFHYAYPETGQYSDAPLNGSTAPIYGPRIKSGSTISIRATGPREFRTQVMFFGRLIREGTFDISEDGQTLLRQSWTPQNPNEKDRLIYDKQ